ncbi:type IV pili methyl-accepting chemotaxis transducer N-terminal domain-containing protein [Vibrio sp. SCSIO 43137]|uniref:type IV pili methyl-accepting chemotaxis transducer N-terminal domain-containing protein n=1 Tax=Vibrio sp. SCSIO 43137 TaxID=3021011 RepID=UPI002307D336|nr:type IV pili methyl-accepting chemotaxis transducer N-terminal domain-containing protein [Vibrio sp. SCSIO 43137]WCE30322.1 type IV pili methyl-accepting chemotaxis transducer N-terminal domain-containing protein [Vibrio sp. SCSIO 43137]
MKIMSFVSKLCLLVPFLGVTISTAYAAPTPAEYGVVLNLSGKQRMLSQKMSKEVALVALGVEAENNLKNLAATSSLFDKTLKGLRDGDNSLGLPATESKRILRQLTKVDEIWAGFYPVVKQIIASKTVNEQQLDSIAKQNLPLLKQMNKAVGLYEKDAKKTGLKSAPGLAATLNLSGKQRMLSQKMSKEYFLIALGYQVEDNKLNLLETYSLFDRTLKGLKDGDDTLDLPGTKPEHIRQQLDVVNGLWQEFQPLVAEGAAHSSAGMSSEQVGQIARLNLPLLKEMNAAVQLYEAEAAK